MNDTERQCKFLREFFKDIDVDGGKLQLKLENCAITIERQATDIERRSLENAALRKDAERYQDAIERLKILAKEGWNSREMLMANPPINIVACRLNEIIQSIKAGSDV